MSVLILSSIILMGAGRFFFFFTPWIQSARRETGRAVGGMGGQMPDTEGHTSADTSLTSLTNLGTFKYTLKSTSALSAVLKKRRRRVG